MNTILKSITMFKGKLEFPRRYMVIMILTLSSTLSSTMIHSTTLTFSQLLNCFECESHFDEKHLCPTSKSFHTNKTVHEHSSAKCTLSKKALQVGYFISRIPAGAISDIYGGKHLVGLSILMTSVVVSLLPVVIKLDQWWLLAMTNLLVGLLMGVTKSASVSLLAHWLPQYQKALLGCIYFCGEILGVLLGTHISNFLTNFTNWEFFFYSWPALGLLHYMVFMVFVYASAKTHPHLSDAEKELLKIGMRFPSRIPWKLILKDGAVWAIFAAQMGHNFVIHLILEDLPNYLKYYIGADMTRPDLISLPLFGLIALAITGGYFADKKVKKQFIPVSYLRCFYIAFGNLLPFIIAMTISIFGCNYYATAIVYSLSIITSGPIYAGAHMNIFDLTNLYVGTIYALTNGLASVFDVIAPVMHQYINREHFHMNWMCIITMDFMIGIISVFLFFISMRGERASWDFID